MASDTKTSRWQRCKYKCIGILGKYLIDLLFLTIRFENRVSPNGQKTLLNGEGICAFWHSRLLLMDYCGRNMELIVFISQSKDGEIISQILKQQGNIPVREIGRASCRERV